jgi:hypothetical protein
MAVQQVQLPPVGNTAAPTFLERWGIVLLACAGGWIILVGSAILTDYFLHQPAMPTLTGLSPDQVREALSIHKELHQQWMESLTSVFDLLVTKTVLPIVTLLLGYLFGKTK